MKAGIFVLVVVVSLVAFGFSADQKSDKSPELIPWWSVNIGGNIHSGSGNYRLSSSVGQSIAGEAAGGNYIMHAGFWNPAITLVGIQEKVIDQIPRVHSISQNYPNPFHRATTICYGIPKTERVKVEVFNVAGQSVRVLVDREESPGCRVIGWDGRDESGVELGCGVYFYRITTPEFQATKKMLRLR
jgi:hypothetical protein